jgi:hypothetical protein
MTADVEGAPLRLHEELLTDGWMLAESDPGAAAALLGQAAIAALSVGDVSRALAVARDAEVVAARGDELAGAVAALALGIALLFGERPADAEPLLARALSVLRSPGVSPPWRPLYQGAAMLYWLERYEEAG